MEGPDFASMFQQWNKELGLQPEPEPEPEEEWECRPTLPPFELNGFVFPRDVGGIIIRFVCSTTWLRTYCCLNHACRRRCEHVNLAIECNRDIRRFEMFHEFHCLSAKLVCKTWNELTKPFKYVKHANLCSDLWFLLKGSSLLSDVADGHVKLLVDYNYLVRLIFFSLYSFLTF